MSVSFERDGALAVIRFDDGKANVLSHAVIEEFHAHLDQVEADETLRATVIVGRPGRFCAGFDLATMNSDAESMRSLVAAGGRLIARLFVLPTPLVAACSGHALAAGALMLLACDERLAAAGGAKIGLNEVTIGLALPSWAVSLARYRLAGHHFDRCVILGELTDPDSAVHAGFVDTVVQAESLEQEALERARVLAGLHRDSVAMTKRRARLAVAQSMTSGIDADVASMTQPPPRPAG
ncbi:MAG: crotonase/enoyl-CoA hydratase family protein [Acidimicrobiales bacterium]